MAAPRVLSANNDTHPAVVEVVFDQNIKPDSALLNPSNYLFNHGAYATNVIPVDEKTVRIVAENLFGYSSFIVYVSSNIVNESDEGMDTNYNAVEFSTSRQAAPNFALAITAENGRLKSGTRVLKSDEDSSNWYLLTESGIDVINKESLRNVAFLLDGYGSYTTIHVNDV